MDREYTWTSARGLNVSDAGSSTLPRRADLGGYTETTLPYYQPYTRSVRTTETEEEYTDSEGCKVQWRTEYVCKACSILLLLALLSAILATSIYFSTASYTDGFAEQSENTSYTSQATSRRDSNSVRAPDWGGPESIPPAAPALNPALTSSVNFLFSLLLLPRILPRMTSHGVPATLFLLVLPNMLPVSTAQDVATGSITFDTLWNADLADSNSSLFQNYTTTLCEQATAGLSDYVVSCETIDFRQGSVIWDYSITCTNITTVTLVQEALTLAVTHANVFSGTFAVPLDINAAAYTECSASEPVCLNGGSCFDISTQDQGFQCLCAIGWWGRFCTINSTECAPADLAMCNDIGTYVCIDETQDNPQCHCRTGFTGTYCETDLDDCASDPCLNGGTCEDCSDSYLCICPDGYVGEHCETDVDECASSPCVNGQCEEGLDFYTCTCSTGYTGLLCEVNIDDCSEDLCLNGGTCLDAVDAYSCACPCGFTGFSCETDIDECASSPCLHNSTCVDEADGYTCTCVTGFAGTECETNLNECESSPCLNGGTCVDLVDGYACDCNADTTGTNCETSVDYDMTGATSMTTLTQYVNVGVTTNVVFQGLTYSSVNVLAGGFVSFGVDYTSISNAELQYCGLDQNTYVVLAPYDDYHHPWYDGGDIYYRETNDATLKALARYDICTFFSNNYDDTTPCDFVPKRLFLVSWTNMGVGNSAVSTRDFQLVIASSNSESYAIFVYLQTAMDNPSRCLRTAGYADLDGLISEDWLFYSELKSILDSGQDRLVYYMGSSADACLLSPCLNGGACASTGDGDYWCLCTTEWTGQTCSDPVSATFANF